MEPTPVSHAVTPAPFIKRLSNELLDMICSLLSKRDLLNSRLAWRELGEMADRHIFRCLVFHLRPADGHWFLHFANRPSVSEHVRSLEFVAFCLPQDMPSFAQYSDLMTGAGKRFVSDEVMQASFQAHKLAHEQQTEIVANGLDFALVRNALPKYKALQKVSISSETARHRPMTRLYPAKQRGTPYRPRNEVLGYLSDRCCRQAEYLQYLSATNLRSLHLHDIHPSFFDTLDERKLQKLIDVCANLESFDLFISGYKRTRLGDRKVDNVQREQRDQQAMLKESHLRRLLGSMTKLKSLEMEFDGDRFAIMDFHDIIPVDMVWNNLVHLKLSRLAIRRQDLEAFLEWHVSTLELIELCGFHLIRSSWTVFFRNFRALCVRKNRRSLYHHWVMRGILKGEVEYHGLNAGHSPVAEEFDFTRLIDMWYPYRNKLIRSR